MNHLTSLALPLVIFALLISTCMVQEIVGQQKKLTASIEGGVPAKDKKPDEVTKQTREFFVKWLEGHGEKEIINDESGVGVKGKDTRLWAFKYAGPDGKKTNSLELEFRVVLPDGREIQEFVGAIGPRNGNANEAAISNFAISTFHTIRLLSQ